MKKVCSKCKVEKNLNEYAKRKDSKDGYRNDCILCQKKIKDKWYLNNRKKLLKRFKEWRVNNKDEKKQLDANYRKNNKDKIKIIHKKWSERNIKHLKEYRSNWYKKKNSIDTQFNLKRKIRKRIDTALRRQEITKKYKTIKLLGCSFEFYKQYIESLFTYGMTWEKLRASEIHIDHKMPCASFDLTKPEEQKKAFNYKNTQPLWKADNLSKGARILNAC